MPNITRGGRLTGLMAYHAGPGRGHEHHDRNRVPGDTARQPGHDAATPGTTTARRTGGGAEEEDRVVYPGRRARGAGSHEAAGHAEALEDP